MATKTSTTPSGLSSIANTVSNVASQVSKGGMTQAQINSAISSLQGAQSQLSSGVSSGQYQNGVDYAALDRPVNAAQTATAIQQERNAVITPDSIKTPTPIIPVYNPQTQDYMSILGSLKPTDTVNQIIDKGAEGQNALFKQMTEALGTPPSTAEAYKQAQNETGILQKQQTVNDLTGQLNQITAQSQANQLSVMGQGRGIPEAIIGGQQAQIAKEAAIQALPVSAALQAAQGNLAMAEQNLNTLFQIKSQDATNQYNYKKELVKGLYDIASSQEKSKLDYALKLDDRRYNETQSNIKYAQDIATMAIKSGQSDIATSIAKLNTSSPTFMSDAFNIQSKIKDPTLALDIALKQAQLTKTNKEISQIGEPTAAEKKAQVAALKSATASIPIMQDKISAINDLYTHSGKDARVGQNAVMRQGGGLYGVQNFLTGSGNDFAGRVHNITNGLSLDSLIQAKERGATFGALSDSELRMLANSATLLNDWEKKDSTGKGIGVWDIDQPSFDRELTRIKTLTQRAIVQSGNSLLSDDEESILNKAYQSKGLSPNQTANLYK